MYVGISYVLRVWQTQIYEAEGPGELMLSLGVVTRYVEEVIQTVTFKQCVYSESS